METPAPFDPKWLQPGESYGEPKHEVDAKLGVDSIYVPVHLAGRSDNDRVLWRINKRAPAAVLIDGNPCDIEVISGTGSLRWINPVNNIQFELSLTPGRRAKVPLGKLYQFGNQGEEPLVLRDTSEDFSADNELSAEQFNDQRALRQLARLAIDWS